MDETTKAKYPDGTLNVDDLTGIGNFTKDDILHVTRVCVGRLQLGKAWEQLERNERHAYLTLAVNALAGKKVEGTIADLPGGNPQLETQFTRLVIQEFKSMGNKWNEEQFLTGYKPVYRGAAREPTIGEEAQTGR